jgi:hypothetical protein
MVESTRPMALHPLVFSGALLAFPILSRSPQEAFENT